MQVAIRSQECQDNQPFSISIIKPTQNPKQTIGKKERKKEEAIKRGQKWGSITRLGGKKGKH